MPQYRFEFKCPGLPDCPGITEVTLLFYYGAVRVGPLNFNHCSWLKCIADKSL